MKHAPTISPYLSVLELSQYLRCQPETIRASVRKGTFKIPHVRSGGGRTSAILFDRQAVANHFAAIAAQAKAELDLFEGLQTAGGLTREAAAEIVFALHEGTISHNDIKDIIAARVVK